MRFSVFWLSVGGGVSMVAATAITSPDPTPAPDVEKALAKLVQERQIAGQLPGISGSLGTDGGCGHIGPLSGCFGAAGSNQTVTVTVTSTPVDAKASTTPAANTTVTGTAGTKSKSGTATAPATGTKATSSSGAGKVREYGSTGMGSVLFVVGCGVVGFAVLMA